jgi:DnaJ like chaperone protein
LSWIGKIVGGTLGLFFGGPLGAIAGVAFGHAFDRAQQADRAEEIPYYDYYRRRLRSEEQAHMTFFVGAFSLLAKLAMVDGRVNSAERETVRRFMSQDLSLDYGSQISAERIFEAALNSPQGYRELAEQFYRTFRMQPQILELMLDVLFRVAVADGGVSKSEGNLILNVARIFRFEQYRYDRIKERYVQDTNRYYAILECEPGDPDEKIKANYRRLVRENHPDAVAAQGLPKEFEKMATDKFRKIQDAYERVRKERGF